MRGLKVTPWHPHIITDFSSIVIGIKAHKHTWNLCIRLYTLECFVRISWSLLVVSCVCCFHLFIYESNIWVHFRPKLLLENNLFLVTVSQRSKLLLCSFSVRSVVCFFEIRTGHHVVKVWTRLKQQTHFKSCSPLNMTGRLLLLMYWSYLHKGKSFTLLGGDCANMSHMLFQQLVFF